jgi:hypothetical protein
MADQPLQATVHFVSGAKLILSEQDGARLETAMLSDEAAVTVRQESDRRRLTIRTASVSSVEFTTAKPRNVGVDPSEWATVRK